LLVKLVIIQLNADLSGSRVTYSEYRLKLIVESLND
jgi:hypothetical protein